MTSVVVAKVCVDIAWLLYVFVCSLDVPGVSLLLCRLPGLLASTIAGVLLICTSIEGVDSSSVSGLG